MRRCDRMRGREVEDRRKEEEMTAPITLPSLNEPTLTELRRRYEETTDAETRTRYQMRVIELDPHEVGQDSANWTTERLAEYLGQHTGIQVTEETVRVYLHAHDYVCKRPTWT